MAKYTYTSINPCHITIRIKEENKAVSLFQGETFELPEDNKAVVRMVAQELLKPVYKTSKKKNING